MEPAGGKDVEEFGSGESLKRTQLPVRSHFFKLVKKTTIVSICVSNLAVNFALLFDLLDFLNVSKFSSAASGIVVSLSLFTIIFKLIGLFAVIKEEFGFSITFAVLTTVLTLAASFLYLVLYDGLLEEIFATVLLSNLVTIFLTFFFALLIRYANHKFKNSISPLPEVVPEP